MLTTIRSGLASAAAVLTLVVAAFIYAATPAAADNARWGAGYFPNVTLTTQDGVQVRFYDDLVKGKIVAINLIYTTCKYACPLETARLTQVAKLLGERMGRDIFFYSITIDPDHDTPQVLKAYAEKYQVGPGWTFLTGKKDEIETISKKLGLYSEPDPSNPDGHMPMLLVGNEETGQWMRNSAMDNPKFLSRTIGDWLNSWQTAKKATRSYSECPALTFDRGAIHVPQPLRRVPHDRPRRALRTGPGRRHHEARSRLAEAVHPRPGGVRAAGDPIALALRAKYQQVVMPSLDLGAGDAAVLIDYIDRRAARSAKRRRAAPRRTTARRLRPRPRPPRT